MHPLPASPPSSKILQRYIFKKQNALIKRSGIVKLEQKPIPGYEDQYYLNPDDMTVVNSKTGRTLKPQFDKRWICRSSAMAK